MTEFSQGERETRPDGPTILKELWTYLGQARDLHNRLELLHDSLRLELEAHEKRAAKVEELERRVIILERASSSPPAAE